MEYYATNLVKGMSHASRWADGSWNKVDPRKLKARAFGGAPFWVWFCSTKEGAQNQLYCNMSSTAPAPVTW